MKYSIAILIAVTVLISGCTSQQEPIKLSLSIDKQPSFNETANLKLTILSSISSQKAKISLILPEGIEIVKGPTEWERDLKPNEKVEIEAKIKITGKDNYSIQASVQTQGQAQAYRTSIPLTQTLAGNQTPQIPQLVPPSGYGGNNGTYNKSWNCNNNWDCSLTQKCINNICSNYTCSGYCEYPGNQQCLKYECCSNSECNPGSLCIGNECRTAILDPTNKIAFFDNVNLNIMNNDGTNVTRLTTSTIFEGEYPDWSPDGTKIAFGRHNIYVININGTNKTLLTSGDHPSWMPDGKKIIYISNEISMNGISMIDIANGNKSHILKGWSPDYPSVSPDGNKVAYTFISPREEQPDIIFIMNSDGSNATQLTAGMGSSWSPDGDKIVYQKAFSNEIFIIDTKTKNKTFLTRGYSPSWSPKGDKIVYSRGGGISIINVNGSDQVNLTDSGNYPVWSPFQT